ncbi:MAG: ATP-binding protein [Candidatus Dormiibacterota bacterium]
MADLEVPLDRLCRRLDPSELGFETTAEITPLAGTVGQPRAIDALGFGLNIRTRGFNLFATGTPGSGRMSTVLDHIDRAAHDRAAPRDWLYVHNFVDPDRPMALSTVAGRGRSLARDLEDLVAESAAVITRAFDDEAYQRSRTTIAAGIEERAAAVRKELEAAALVAGFLLQFTPGGLGLVPLRAGHPLTPDQVGALSTDEREGLQRRAIDLERQLEVELPRMRQVEVEGAKQLAGLDRETAMRAIAPVLNAVREKYREEASVLDHLAAIEADIPDHLPDFRRGQVPDQQGRANLLGILEGSDDHTARYRANVIVDNADVAGAPVIVERNPTYYNLFGRVEYRATFGAMVTDFRHIRGGALHRANGGFLVIDAMRMLQQPFVWDSLKRALTTETVVIENLAEQVTLIPTSSLHPSAIPLDVKVVLVGSPALYSLLSAVDEDFMGLFKVRADFAPEMPWSAENVTSYAAFIRQVVDRLQLKHFEKDAIARIVEFGGRLRDDQRRLSTRLADIADVAAEASYWAGATAHDVVTRADVERAIGERQYRSNLTEERVHQFIDERTIHIETEGSRVGQVNGLSVVGVGGYTFGMPTRITASVSIGHGRFESIEREINASGPIHSKGFLILSGYLAEQYGQDHPFPMRATITFEQSYDEVEGDSASSTELYAILSALSGLPINQSVAVTGSVDQHGRIQAVGGINEKIEGFFKVCLARGLTGEHGVMMPSTNVDNLMLTDAVIDAVRERRFHIWAVTSVDEGIELLTRRQAGRLEHGSFPEGTVHRLVADRCRSAAERLRRYARMNGEGAEA